MFEVGDKVTYEFQPGRTGIGSVVYGPFRLAGAGTQMCVVEWLAGDFKGEAQTLPVERLKPAPRFEMGQKVRFQYTPEGESYELVAGPFLAVDESFYVLKDKDGNHDTSFDKYMVPVVE
ncbi:hypothetical protein [Streptomyces sp. WG5]|uniref:hypothetical protein n=1 Tax=Streptomyces sp. WG5 TaxID=3417648 RepID=UPI003CED685F